MSLADPHLLHLAVLVGVGTEVPRVDLVLADLHLVDVLHLGQSFVLLKLGVRSTDQSRGQILGANKFSNGQIADYKIF